MDIHLGSDSVQIKPIKYRLVKQDPFSIHVGFGLVQIRLGFVFFVQP